MNWKCPHCTSTEGVHLYESLPSYHNVEITEDGKADVYWEECDVDWDGNSDYKIQCLACGAEVDMEIQR